VPIDSAINTSKIVDTYTKSGDIGQYSTIFAMVPDYGLGFSVLAVGEGTSPGVAVQLARAYIVDAFVRSIPPRPYSKLTLDTVQRLRGRLEGASRGELQRNIRCGPEDEFLNYAGC
jgi:hypothetical protein